MYQSLVDFSVPCMVVDSTSQITKVMGFYTGYFGHMTEYTCAVHEYPCGFVLSDDWLSIFLMIDRSFHYMALFTFHPNIRIFHLQPIRFHEASTQHMAIMKVCHFEKKVHQSTKDFKQATSINGEHSNICSIVIFNVVDHTFRFELSDESRCNLIHG